MSGPKLWISLRSSVHSISSLANSLSKLKTCMFQLVYPPWPDFGFPDLYRVAKCPVFNRTVRYLPGLSGI